MDELHHNVDELIEVSMIEPARYRIECWSQALNNHKRHSSFHTQGWVYTREVGFTCSCSGQEQEWRISLTSIRSALPEVRDAFMRRYNTGFFKGRKKLRLETRRANRRAKALLYRHLSKEQKWELRATSAITITGQDDRTYLITDGSCNNIFLLDENGKKQFRLCAVAMRNIEYGIFSSLPVYDLMLAQKLTIEYDIRSLLTVANAMNVSTGHFFPGHLLLEDEWPDSVHCNIRIEDERFRVENETHNIVPYEIVEEPENWIMERLNSTSENSVIEGDNNGSTNTETETC